MTVCLRCDWSGETRSETCPRCGAALYRPGPAHPDPPAEAPPRGAGEGRRRRAHPLGVLAAAAVAALAAAWWFVAALTRPPPPTGPAYRGSLVYAVVGQDGTARLYRWELSTGSVSPGPVLTDPIELRASGAADPGWLGVTERLPDGSARASVIRLLEPGERPEVVMRGSLIAWGPLAHSVVGFTGGPEVDGCPSVSIHFRDILVGARIPEFRGPALCGDVVSLGRDPLVTYMTIRSGGDVRIVSLAARPSTVLSGHELLSVSATSEMLVASAEDARAGTGVALYRRGDEAPRVSYGVGADDLVVSRVLSWSPDSRRALVAGVVDAVVGVFSVDASSGAGRREPTLVVETGAPSWATYADDGVAYVAADGRVLAWLDGRIVPLRLPAGAPRPNGPIAWLG